MLLKIVRNLTSEEILERIRKFEKEFGFVKLNKRRGRAIIPETLVKEITFLIR